MALSKIRNDSLADTAVHGRRNLIINGAMNVDQRNTTTTYSNSGGFGAADRISFRRAGTWTTTTFDISQESTTGLDEFPKCSQMKVQDAVANPNANDDTYCSFSYRFEGQNLQHLKWGTSDAKAVTVSFYVKSPVAGTYCFSLHAIDANTAYIAEYTIDSADTWERKVITIAAPTTSNVGTKIANDNTIGIGLYWAFSGNTTGNASFRGAVGWNTQQVHWTSNQANAFSTLNNAVQLTGVQLEVGDKATPFEHRSYGEELALCQRYYEKITGYLLWSSNSGSGTHYGTIEFKQTKRATPSFSSHSDTVATTFNLNADSHCVSRASYNPNVRNPEYDAEL